MCCFFFFSFSIWYTVLFVTTNCADPDPNDLIDILEQSLHCLLGFALFILSRDMANTVYPDKRFLIWVFLVCTCSTVPVFRPFYFYSYLRFVKRKTSESDDLHELSDLDIFVCQFSSCIFTCMYPSI